MKKIWNMICHRQVHDRALKSLMMLITVVFYFYDDELHETYYNSRNDYPYYLYHTNILNRLCFLSS